MITVIAHHNQLYYKRFDSYSIAGSPAFVNNSVLLLSLFECCHFQFIPNTKYFLLVKGLNAYRGKVNLLNEKPTIIPGSHMFAVL